MGITLRLGEKVAKIEHLTPEPADGQRRTAAPLVQATLEIGKHLRAQTLLYAVGRQGTTGALQLDKAGLNADDRERLKVNEHYQTDRPAHLRRRRRDRLPRAGQHRDGAGPPGGLPRLRRRRRARMPELFPYGIYAIPEISMVGKTEDQLTDAGIPYEAGVAQYKELARGQLLGDDTGMLKLLIHQDNHQILGVHAIGTGATELIHIGQAVMAFKRHASTTSSTTSSTSPRWPRRTRWRR